jgi:hypothetical protein
MILKTVWNRQQGSFSVKIRGDMESPVQVPDLEPKRKRGRRIRRALCAVRDFIERHLTPNAIVVIGAFFLIASWIYPPWVQRTWHGWNFIFDTNTGSARIDLTRLLLIDLIIASLGGLLAWAISRNAGARRTAARIVFYSIVVLVLAVPTVATVWLGLVTVPAIKQKLFAAELTDEEVFGTQWKNAPVVVDDVVGVDALKRIALFDLGVSPGSDYLYIESIYGRIRNDLSRSVQNVQLRASIYNPAGQLLEVKGFALQNPALRPGVPVSFQNYEGVHHLPEGWKYHLEVTEAHYVH